MKRHPLAVYAGERLDPRTPNGVLRASCVRVTVDGRPLDPRRSQCIWNHSPTGFEWGYCGSGPAQLALALVLDATDDMVRALKSYHWFKRAVVSQWGDRWTITAAEVFWWLNRWAREDPRAQEPDDEGEGDPSIEVRAEEGGGQC